MLTLEHAKEIAASHIREMEVSLNICLKVVKVQEELFGWIFFYQSKEYLETGALSAMLAGNAPFVVLRKSGVIETLGTAKPVNSYIEEMQKKWTGS